MPLRAPHRRLQRARRRLPERRHLASEQPPPRGALLRLSVGSHPVELGLQPFGPRFLAARGLAQGELFDLDGLQATLQPIQLRQDLLGLVLQGSNSLGETLRGLRRRARFLRAGWGASGGKTSSRGIATVSDETAAFLSSKLARAALAGTSHGPGAPSTRLGPRSPSSSPARSIWRMRAGEMPSTRAASYAV